MFKRLKRLRKDLLGSSKAGRTATVLPDDVFIVSYPRSGNTWTRFLISNLVYARQEPTNFLNLEERIPDIYQNSNATLMKLKKPRILKSHEPFFSRYDKVIYIVRNPIYVAVSFFYYMVKIRKINEDYPLADFVRRFLDGGLDSFGTWGEHVGSWLAARRGSRNFLFLRYEDLSEHTEDRLRQIARFLNIEASAEDLSNAVARSSAGRMQGLEKEQAHQWRPLKGAREDILFVGSAATGDCGRERELPPDLAAMIKDRWRELMDEIGYR